MDILEGIFLVAAGMFAGFINSIAGGGSLLIMPLLIFMGLPSAEANGSNRVAIFVQNIFSDVKCEIEILSFQQIGEVESYRIS